MVTAKLGNEDAFYRHCISARHVAELYCVSYSELCQLYEWLFNLKIPKKIIEPLWIAVHATERADNRIGSKTEVVLHMANVLLEELEKK